MLGHVEGIAAVIVLAVPHLRKFELGRSMVAHGLRGALVGELHLILAPELLAPRKVVVEINMVDFQPVVGIGGKRLGHGYGFGKPAAHDGQVSDTDILRLVGLDIQNDRYTAFPGRFVDRKPIRIGGNGIPPVGQHIQRRFRPRTQRTGSDNLYADFTYGESGCRIFRFVLDTGRKTTGTTHQKQQV